MDAKRQLHDEVTALREMIASDGWEIIAKSLASDLITEDENLNSTPQKLRTETPEETSRRLLSASVTRTRLRELVGLPETLVAQKIRAIQSGK
tara:strand:- start:146 stop:424 length:279 start_codon:yes stop_codon:yes gene_type:complete